MPMRRLLLLLLTLLPLRATAQTPAVADSIRRVLPGLMTQFGVPGVQVALIEHGEVTWSEGFGLADTAGMRVTDSTVFQVASVSKSVAAWGILKLVEQNRLELDAPVETYLKRWHIPASEFDAGGVTLRRLLSHTAGLVPSGYPGHYPHLPLPTLEENLNGASNGAGPVKLTGAPGVEWRYAGGGFTVAQLLVEEVSGRTFAAFMAEEVLAPLGMRHSAYEWTAALRPLTAKAYDPAGRELPNYTWTEQAAAGLYTTARSLGRLVAAGMPGPAGEPPGRGVLRPETVALMYAPAPRAELRNREGVVTNRYGLGHLITQLEGGLVLVGHGGSNRGWKARWVAAPAAGAGIVVLTNHDRGGTVHQGLVCTWARVALRRNLPDCDAS